MVLCSFSKKIAETAFFFNLWFSLRILILSKKVPILENKVGNNKDKSLKGSPIVTCFLFLKIAAPGMNFCNSKALKSRYF